MRSISSPLSHTSAHDDVPILRSRKIHCSWGRSSTPWRITNGLIASTAAAFLARRPHLFAALMCHLSRAVEGTTERAYAPRDASPPIRVSIPIQFHQDEY